jgi:ADP-heptose:LPS heptosyltransferase
VKEIKKILIFKLCCLGDVVFMTPAISSLKKNFPDAKFTFIHSPWIKDIINYVAEIDDTIEVDLHSQKNIFFKLFDVAKLIITLRKRKFDLVFLGHRNNAFGIILFLASIKYRFGFKNTMFINKPAVFDDTIKESKRYLKILNDNNLQVSMKNTHLTKPCNPQEIKSLLNIPGESFVIGVFPFGGINPGTGMNIKRWGKENYFKLISLIRKNHPGIQIVLFEGVQENEKLIYKNEFEDVKISKIDFNKISVCNLFVSGDTGPLHIAAAFDISTLSIFGPSDPRLVAPFDYDNSKVIHKYIWTKPECSPCYTPETAINKNNPKYWNKNSFICHTGNHKCIKEISVEYVYKNLIGIINEIKNTDE